MTITKDQDLLSKKDLHFDLSRIYVYDLREDLNKKNLIVKFSRLSKFSIRNKLGNLHFALKRKFHGSFLCKNYKYKSGTPYIAPLEAINPEKTEIHSDDYFRAIFRCEKKFWGGIDVHINSKIIGEIFFSCEKINFHSFEESNAKEFAEGLDKARNTESLG